MLPISSRTKVVPLLFLALVILMAAGCRGDEEGLSQNLQATVEARVHATLAASQGGMTTPQVANETPTPSPVPTSTLVPRPSPTPTPVPTPTATPTPVPTPTSAPSPGPTPVYTPIPSPSPTPTPTPTSVPAPTPIPESDLQVILEADTTGIVPGKEVSIRFTVTNTGSQDDEGVILEFSHSPLFVPVSLSPAAQCAGLTCNLGSIPVNESLGGELTLQPQVFLDLDLPLVNTVDALVHGNGLDRDSANNEVSIQFGYPDGVPGNLLWSTLLPFRTSLLNGRIIVEDAVYFGASRRIYAVSKSTGEFRWHYGLEGRARTLGLHDGALIATDGNVYSLDPANGDVNWKYVTGGDPAGTEYARLVNGTIYLKQLNRHGFYSIDASTGELNWKQNPISARGHRLDPVTIEGDTVLVTQNHAVISISRMTGAINWVYEAEDFPRFYIRPIIHKGVIYFVTRKHIFGLDLITGEVLLRRPARLMFENIKNETVKLTLSGGLFSNDKVYFGVNNLDVFALDESMETVLWHYKYGGDPPKSWYTGYVGFAANGLIYLTQPFDTTKEGEVLKHVDGVYALDDLSGRRLWQFDSLGSPRNVTFHNDVIYVSSRQSLPDDYFAGHIEVFDALTGELRRRIDFSREPNRSGNRLNYTISNGVLYGFGNSRLFALTVER